MEEIKDKKKLNKKPLLICFAIALVFALIGFIDIKSNAAESDNSIEFIMPIYTEDMNCANVHKEVIYGQEDMEVYYIQSHNEPSSDYLTYALAYVVSDYPMTNAEFNSYDGGQTFFEDTYGPYSSVEFSVNGKIKYICQVTNRNEWSGVSFVDFDFKWDNCKKITRWYDMAEFQQAYIDNSLEIEVDYNSFEVDDDMLVPTNIKLNKLVNNVKVGLKNYDEVFHYITWDNSLDFPLQIEITPIVQFYEQKYLGFGYGKWVKNSSLNFFISETIEGGISKYSFETREGTGSYIIDEDPYLYREIIDYWNIQKEEGDYSTFGDFSTYFTCGYRIRYIDIDNEKASPWVYIMPGTEIDSRLSYVEYGNGEQTIEKDANGVNDKFNDSELGDMVDSVDKENEFKDKYEIVDGDVDTQEAINWLYSVVNFIKGTPQVVGSVLGFLPQPILYGMYVCIFLGVIASGLAIVKALL